MVVRVDGKEHRQGVSKAGKNYDFITLHFLGKQRGVEGQAAITKIIDNTLIPYEKILVGQYYDLEPDLNGNIIGISVAKT